MSRPTTHRAAAAAAALAAVLALGAAGPASAAPSTPAPGAAAPTATARLSAASPIGSVAIARVSLTDDVVEVPTSVQAWPGLASVGTALSRSGSCCASGIVGLGELAQISAGSSTWQGPTLVDARGIPLGAYTLTAIATSEAGTEAYKNVPVTVKSGSRVALTTTRSGGSVSLSADADYWNANRQAWVSYAGAKVSFQTRLADGTWSQFATGTADSRGIARAVGKATTPRVWRAVVVETGLVWPAASRESTR